MTSTSVKPNMLPPGLVSSLQDVLNKRGGGGDGDQSKDKVADSTQPSTSEPAQDPVDSSKPIVLVTNGDGIESPGLTYLVEALVRQGLYNVHVCAPQSWVLSKFCFFSFLFCLLWFASNLGMWWLVSYWLFSAFWCSPPLSFLIWVGGFSFISPWFCIMLLVSLAFVIWVSGILSFLVLGLGFLIL